MNEVFAAFSNRDTAVVFWITAIIIFVLCKKSLRKSLPDVFRALLAKPLLISFIIFLDYILLLVLFLQIIGFWEISLVKNYGFLVV